MINFKPLLYNNFYLIIISPLFFFFLKKKKKKKKKKYSYNVFVINCIITATYFPCFYNYFLNDIPN